jgi:CYTH domain-containing protein
MAKTELVVAEIELHSEDETLKTKSGKGMTNDNRYYNLFALILKEIIFFKTPKES